MFSSILDISSFFIGMLINLLLIALICYYFKRKYESLEVAQNEQAKILYNLIQSQTPRKQFDINELMNNNITKTLDNFEVIESDSESDSESESSISPRSLIQQCMYMTLRIHLRIIEMKKKNNGKFYALI